MLGGWGEEGWPYFLHLNVGGKMFLNSALESDMVPADEWQAVLSLSGDFFFFQEIPE